MKKIIISLLVSTMFLTACSLKDSDGKSGQNNKADKEITENSNDTNEEKDSTQNTEDNKDNNTTGNYDNDSDNNSSIESSNNTSGESQSPSDNSINKENISEKVKDYIINGQGDKPEAEKYKWSTRFLNEVNIAALYDNYIASGGNSSDIEEFAKYITLNAPILSNWEELFKEDLKDTYGEEVVKLEHLEGDLYQAYVNKDGSEVPFVVVSARTGYFHG